jgi:hypothetical protein
MTNDFSVLHRESLSVSLRLSASLSYELNHLLRSSGRPPPSQPFILVCIWLDLLLYTCVIQESTVFEQSEADYSDYWPIAMPPSTLKEWPVT